MKAKKNQLLCAALAGAMLLAGCGAADDNAADGQESTESSVTETLADARADSSDASADSATSLKDIDVESYVTLGEYLGLEISVSPVEEVTEDKVKAYMSLNYFDALGDPGSGTTDRAVEVGDTINLDYSGSKDGEVFDGGTAESQLLTIGSGAFIDGFEDGLVGVMPGETVDLDLTFPENYGSEDLAGQDVVFTCTVNYICEIDETQIAELGYENVSTLDELNAYMRDMLESDAEDTYFNNASTALMEQITENATFADELPAEKLAAEREMFAEQLDEWANSYYGIDAETLYTYNGMDYESTLDAYAEEATRQLLVIQAIANAENLNLSDDEVYAKLDEDAAAYGTTREELLADTSLEEYRESYLYQAVSEFLLENAVNTAQ